jgi:tetratricopeptide (TPR) repeat protein
MSDFSLKDLQNEISLLARMHADISTFISEIERLIRYEDQDEIHGKGMVLFIAGQTLIAEGLFEHALASFNNASKYLEPSGDRENLLACYGNQGYIYAHFGDYKRAIKLYEKACNVAEDIQDKQAILKCYANLSLAYYNIGNNSKAISFFSKIPHATKLFADEEQEAQFYRLIGNAYFFVQDYRSAIELYQKALEFLHSSRTAEESRVCNGIGTALYALGDVGESILYHNKALQIASDREDMEESARSLSNLSNCYSSLWNFEKALFCNNQAIQILGELDINSYSSSGRTELLRLKSSVLTNAGLAIFGLGNYEKALEYHYAALQSAKKIEWRDEITRCNRNLGITFLKIGQYRRAIRFFRNALRSATMIHNRAEIATACFDLGLAYSGLAEYNMAGRFLSRSLRHARRIGNLSLQRVIYNVRGKMWYERKNNRIAYQSFKKSIELADLIAKKIIGEDHKVSFFGGIPESYEYMIKLCIQLRRIEDAHFYIERSKSRAFLEMLAKTEIKPTMEPSKKLKELLMKEEKQLIKLRDLQIQHLRTNNPDVHPYEIEIATETLKSIYSQIQQIDPEYVLLRNGDPLSLKEIRKIFQ